MEIQRRLTVELCAYTVTPGAVLLILKCFNNSAFLNVVCVSWKLKSWMIDCCYPAVYDFIS